MLVGLVGLDGDCWKICSIKGKARVVSEVSHEARVEGTKITMMTITDMARVADVMVEH